MLCTINNIIFYLRIKQFKNTTLQYYIKTIFLIVTMKKKKENKIIEITILTLFMHSSHLPAPTSAAQQRHIRRRFAGFLSQKHDHINESSQNKPIRLLIVQIQITKQQLFQKLPIHIPIMLHPHLHHLLHRPPEIVVRIRRIRHQRDEILRRQRTVRRR